jgi:hypothetical protein
MLWFYNQQKVNTNFDLKSQKNVKQKHLEVNHTMICDDGPCFKNQNIKNWNFFHNCLPKSRDWSNFSVFRFF